MIDTTQDPKAATDFASPFVPVIFANGRDDDLPGLIAAVENRSVQYGDRIHVPGEPVDISGREMWFSSPLFICGCNTPTPTDLKPGTVVVRAARLSRPVAITNCDLRFSYPPQS